MNQIASLDGDRTAVLFDTIARAVMEPSVDATKMREIYSIYRDIERDRARGAYQRAKARVQAELQPIVRNAVNDHIGNHYATLDAIVESAGPIYTKHGFTLDFRAEDPRAHPSNVRLVCTCAYAPEGQPIPYYEESPLESPPDADGSRGNRNKTPIQAVVSTSTYLRKVLTCLAFNIVMKHDPSDDDGENGRRIRRRRETIDGEAEARETGHARRSGVNVWDWLDAFGRDVEAAATPDAIEDILADEQVQKVSKWLAETLSQKSANARFRNHVADAMKRLNRMKNALPPPDVTFPFNLFDKQSAPVENGAAPPGWEGL